MQIEHTSGDITNTDKLTDADALLMETSQNLHELFCRYNRQLLIVGEMRVCEGGTGGIFFSISPKGTAKKNPEKYRHSAAQFMDRLDTCVRIMSHNQLSIQPTPPAP